MFATSWNGREHPSANDLHIAVHTRSRGLTVVTNNLGEFSLVHGLLRENWTAP